MATHEVFNFKSLNGLQAKITELGVDIPLSEDISPLGKRVKIGTKTTPNAIAVLPMEGCDANPNGSPSELVRRRYLRYAKGGAGLIWWEACAVIPQGRANPLQKMLTVDNVGLFASLLKESNAAAVDTNGVENKPVNILQMTHSGRYSRPSTHNFEPVVSQHDPILDPRVGIDSNYPVVTDTYLDDLVEHYILCAKLAEDAGFDGVDIKSCHRYLLNELLASHTREGRYGGCFENRSRLLLDIISEVKKAVSDDFIIACRFNVFDAHPYPYGFGTSKDYFLSPGDISIKRKDSDGIIRYDSSEPLTLAKKLCENGVSLLGISAGNPYYIYPQVTRPFDIPSLGVPTPNEHPLESTQRLFRFVADVQKTVGDVPVVGTGYSWLRKFIPYAGAANLAAGKCSFVGLGRSSFAYPDAPKDMLKNQMDSKKCCVACSKCTQIMRDHGRTGCVIKDSKVYLPLYNESREDAIQRGKDNDK